MRPQSGQFLHYNYNSLYYIEKIRTKKIHVKCVNLQVQIFQTKKNIKSISFFAKELLQAKNPFKNQVARFVGFFTIYVCAYCFINNNDIELIFFENERAGRKEKFRSNLIFITLLFMDI